MRITYKCSVAVQGLDLFSEIQAALVSIRRIFLLLLALTRESWPKGASKSFFKLLCCKCHKTAILVLFQQDFVNLPLTLEAVLKSPTSELLSKAILKWFRGWGSEDGIQVWII